MALKSECDKPVTYAVAMNTDDWVVNMEHAYADFDLVQCKPAPDEQDVVECMIRVTPEKPVTGWQLRKEAYGIHWAYKVDKSEDPSEKK